MSVANWKTIWSKKIKRDISRQRENKYFFNNVNTKRFDGNDNNLNNTEVLYSALIVRGWPDRSLQGMFARGATRGLFSPALPQFFTEMSRGKSGLPGVGQYF